MTEEKKKKQKKDKALILGTASTSAGLAPQDDPSFFVCGLAWRKSGQNPDRVYEMHKKGTSSVQMNEKYITHLKKLVDNGAEVVSAEEIAGVKSTIYPLQEVIDYLGGPDDGYNNGDYFMSSIAFQLAHLMYEGWREVHIYGVDLSTDSEYHHQRPNLEYLIGMARGMGIKVYVPRQAALVKGTHRYGYQPLPGEGAITKAQLKKRRDQYDKEYEESKARFYTIDGARQVIEEQIKYMDQLAKGIDPGPYSGHQK